MNDILPTELIYKHILPRAPQLGLTCKEFWQYIPKNNIDIINNVKFPSVKNKNPVYFTKGDIIFEYEFKNNISDDTSSIFGSIMKIILIIFYYYFFFIVLVLYNFATGLCSIT